MNNEELKQKYDEFTQVWKFYKEYSEIKDTDTYWENAIDAADELARKHGNGRFIRDLIMAVMSEFERKAKEMRNNAETQPGI